MVHLGSQAVIQAVDRFVERLLYVKLPRPKDAKQAVNTILHMLDSVTIPRGVNMKENGQPSYTQYQTVLDLKSGDVFCTLW